MIRLSELATCGVTLEWHEAVAVITAFTDVVWSARLSQAPTLDSAALTAQGEVLLLGGAHESGSVTNGLACGLAALLASIPCPAELRRIVVDSTGPSATITTPQDFAHALVFFERPSRQDVLCHLVRRAAHPVAHSRHEIDRLAARARVSEASIDQLVRAIPPIVAPPARRLAARAALSVAVFGAVALVAATLLSTAPVTDAVAPPTIDASADHEVATAGAPETSPQVVPARDVPAARSPGPRAASPPRAAGTDNAASVPIDMRQEPDVVVSVTEMGGAPLPAEVTTPGPEPAPAAGPSTRVYSTADAGVTPPALVKPHLPAEPPSDLPASQIGTLELTVGTTGAVEQVHLISPSNRFQERMLMAAAKAWRFRPATKDGRPVRFRTRIRVTL